VVEARRLVDALEAAAPDDPDTVALAAIRDLLDGRMRNAVARLEASRASSPRLARLRDRVASGEVTLVADGLPVAFAYHRDALRNGQLVRELGESGPNLLNPTDIGQAALDHLAERTLEVRLTSDAAGRDLVSISDGTARCALALPAPAAPAQVSLWQRLRGKGGAEPRGPVPLSLTLHGPPLHVFALGAGIVRRLEAHGRRSIDQLVPQIPDRDAEVARWRWFRVEELREMLT
jgi:hypothetical protein